MIFPKFSLHFMLHLLARWALSSFGPSVARVLLILLLPGWRIVALQTCVSGILENPGKSDSWTRGLMENGKGVAENQ